MGGAGSGFALWENLWEAPRRLCVLWEGRVYRREDKGSSCPLPSHRPEHGPDFKSLMVRE